MSNTNNIYCDTESRIFYISDNIDNNSVGKVNFGLLKLIDEDNKKEKELKDFKREPIHLFVNSFGGTVYDMWSLIDIILQSKTPIYTYCTGYAMSAACEIFLAGHKRFVSKHAILMYHQLSAWSEGTIQDLKFDLEMLEKIQKQMEEYVVGRTKVNYVTLKEIRERKKDWYIEADEAIELEFAHEII